VAPGYDQTCARRGGAVWCWGRPPAAKVRPSQPSWLHPRRLEGIDGVVDLAAGFGFFCALHHDGAVSCWGDNTHGQLGDGTVEWRARPARVSGVDDAQALVADYGRACVVTRSGEAWCWGEGRSTPAPVEDLRRFRGRLRQVALSDGHWCVLLESGEAYCQGHNDSGQIGNGEGGCRPDPTAPSCTGRRSRCRRRQICAEAERFVRVRGLEPAVELALGNGFSCARHRDGTVSCWGRNAQGQLGRGTVSLGEETHRPAPVATVDDAVGLCADSTRACVLRRGGTAACWGQNVFGELGDGTTANRPAPVPVAGLSSLADLEAGFDHGCARDSGGALFCWGDNTYGELGDGTTERRPTPQPVLAAPEGSEARP
jgi:alpha-tubulin suppressor-like RCC1 family protein